MYFSSLSPFWRWQNSTVHALVLTKDTGLILDLFGSMADNHRIK